MWTKMQDTIMSSQNHNVFVRHLSRHQDDVIKWTYFPRCWPFMGGIHRSLVDCPHKGQWRGALIFPLINIHSWEATWSPNRCSIQKQLDMCSYLKCEYLFCIILLQVLRYCDDDVFLVFPHKSYLTAKVLFYIDDTHTYHKNMTSTDVTTE